MAKNKNLTQAKKAKNDEFYTLISDVEKELKHYKKYFEGKVVYCNCDDPEESNFWKFFELNFEEYKLKKLISTHYDAEKPTYKLELSADIDGDGKITKGDIVKTPLKQNGDFRSEESINLLKESDIICTNPPWSLLNDYIGLLLKYNKDFLILGNQNAVTYSNVFPGILSGKIRLGLSTNGSNRWFEVPSSYAPKANAAGYKVENGKAYLFVNSVTWFTTLPQSEFYEELTLVKDFKLENYPVYDNSCFFYVNRVSNLPKDRKIKIPIPKNIEIWKNFYKNDLKIIGDECIINRPVFGVPITFLYKHNPKQFNLIGKTDSGKVTKYNLCNPTINGDNKFKHILIRLSN